ncbi:helix-turn-helix domain-containing protein [Xylanimonas cellulosilytica]|uniref:helix-turn-helix domain-containing protein n=1 Tax=Xylanimonas cellulosilytica TaxID=186189 RepID=UPI00019C0F36|nr:helix-turn-helix domain-containing protein [Xylanimonas cellulosilytica]
MSAASLLTRMRTRRGLSMNAVAALAGVPASTISRIEAGKIEPTVAMLDRIATAIGFRLDAEVTESGTDAPFVAPLRRLAEGSPDARGAVLATFPIVAALAPVTRRAGVRRVELTVALPEALAALRSEDAGPVVSSLEAFASDVGVVRSFTPVVYVTDPKVVRSLRDVSRGSSTVMLLMPTTDNVRAFTREVDGVAMVSPEWGLLDALASPGRQADVARTVLEASLVRPETAVA